MMLIKKSLAIAAMAALLVPAGAFAQSSSDDTYGGPGNVVQGLEQGGGSGGGNAPAEATSPATSPTKQVQSSQGGLPFTGADLGVLAAAGGMLLGLGFGLRRLTHRPTEA
jgi:hypothetical protein